MDSRMTVEVQGLFGQFYPALVTGFSEGDFINLVIGQCEEVKRVHLTNTRLPPVARQSPECKISSGDAVEAFCKLPTDLITTASANDPELAVTLQNEAVFGDAWWQAKVREVKGSFAVVLLSLRIGPPNGTVMQQQAEIVELDKLRPANTQPMLTSKSVHRFSILLGSDDVLEFCSTTQQDLNKDLRERCGGALLVSYNRETKSIDFQSLSERVIRKVEMLADTHERRIRELFRLDEQTKRLYGMSLNSNSRSGATNNANFVDEFVVSQSVLSAALQNLPKARKLDGITAIDVDKDSGRFRVAGEREDAVRDARNLLEFVEVTIGVPAVYASRIIGRLGANIQRIVDKSNVLRVSVLGEADRAAATSGSDPNAIGVNTGDVPFRFMGSREAIDNARMMLEYRIETLREFDRLRAGLTTGTPPCISAAQQFSDGHSLPAGHANSLLVGTTLPSGTPPNGEPSSSTSGFNTGGSTASVNTVGRSHNAFRNASSSGEREREDAESGTHARPTLHGRGVTSASGSGSGSRRAAYPDSDGVYDHGVPYGNADAARRNHGTNAQRQTTSAGVSRSRNQPGLPHRNGNGRRNEAYGAQPTRQRRYSARPCGTRPDAESAGYDTDSAVQVGRQTLGLLRDTQSRESLMALHASPLVTEIDLNQTFDDHILVTHDSAAENATATNGELNGTAKQTQPSTRDGGYGASSNRSQGEQKTTNGNTAPAVTKKQPTASLTEGGESQQQRRSGNGSGSNTRRRRRPPPADANANAGTNGNDQVAATTEAK